VWIKRYCALKSFKGWNWYSTRRWEAGRQKWRSAFSLSTQFKIMRFNPGRIVATPGALNVLARNGDSGRAYLKRHANGDWGVIGDEDKAEVCGRKAAQNHVGISAHKWHQDLGNHGGRQVLNVHFIAVRVLKRAPAVAGAFFMLGGLPEAP
jgi:hypothetical protein